MSRPDKRHRLRNDKYCVGVITDRIVGTTRGRVYYPMLARFPGDPEAVCSNRTEIKRLVKKRGWKCEGMVDVD